MKKIPLILSVLAIFIIGSASMVSADILKGTKKNPITTAWYDSTVLNKGYQPHFDAARDYWNNISSKVHIYKNVHTYQTGQDKYFVGSYNSSDPEYLGLMTPYYYFWGKLIRAFPGDDWEYSIVTIYEGQMKDTAKRKGLSYSMGHIMYNAAHEVGHSVKMAHPNYNPSIKSIMWQGWGASLPSTPHNQDIYELRYKWGN